MDKVIIGMSCVVGFVVVIILLLALPTMLLWNWLCPMLFHLPAITFWQALGLVTLARCLMPCKVK